MNNKELALSQISNRTYSIQFVNIRDTLLSNMIQLIKKYHGKWNPIIHQYQINIQQTTEFIKAAQELDHKLSIKDVPSNYLRSLLSHRGKEKDSKILHILPRQKWTRIFAFDPFLVKRFDFAAEFGTKKEKNFKRLLLIVWQVMRRKWQFQLSDRKVYYQVADYYELITPNDIYKIGSNANLKQGQFDILTYERLSDMHQTLTKSALEKYSTIMLDDSELWIEPENTLYKNAELGTIMRNLLKNKYSASKELLLFTSRFVLQRAPLALEIANILLPGNFGFEAVSIAKGEANDATWMKKRYVNESRHYRELMFIFNSMFLVNLQQFEKKVSEITSGTQSNFKMDNFYGISLDETQTKKLGGIGNKYKTVNKKEALERFQGQRSIGCFINSRSSEAKYIQEFGKTITNFKLPHIFKFMYHLTKDLKLRTIVLVENQSTQQKIQNFMKEQSISYVAYQINTQQLCQAEMCFMKRDNPNPSVYLLVRDSLLKQYKTAHQQRQKKLELEFQRQAEQQLGIKRGGLFQINNGVGSSLFNSSADILPLKKINNAHHLIMVDTFWQQFSFDKENILNNILDCKLPAFKQAEARMAAKSNQTGLIDNYDEFIIEKRIEIVRHFFTVRDDTFNQANLVFRYLRNLQTIPQSLSPQEQSFDLQSKFEQICNENKIAAKTVITEVLDIDEEFDKLQFEVLKQKQKGDVQSSDQKPIYNTVNTNIEGLIIETPLIDDLKKMSEKNPSKMEIEIKTDKKQILDALEEYGSQSETSQSEYEQSQEQLQKYLVEPQLQKKTRKQMKQHMKQQIKENKQQKVQQQNKKEPRKQKVVRFSNAHQQIIMPKMKEPSIKVPKTQKYSELQQQAMAKVKQNEQAQARRRQALRREMLSRPLNNQHFHHQKLHDRGYRNQAVWKNKAKEQKIIGKKLKRLRVMLYNGKSTINRQIVFDDDEIENIQK